MPTLYIYLIVAAVFLGLVGVVKHQHDEIIQLESSKVIWEDANEKLGKKITTQNAELREGQLKYQASQDQLNVAKGLNAALSTQFKGIREELKKMPLAKTCDEAIVELKTNASKTAKRWNTK